MGCERVPAMTLDSLFAQLNMTRIDVLRINVNGRECPALLGGQQLLRDHRPRLVQVQSTWQSSEKCVREAAKQHGYSVSQRGDISLMEADMENRPAARATGPTSSVAEANRWLQKWLLTVRAVR